MENIYSNIFSFNKKMLKKTVKILEQGNNVGLPTETVYGLAGNAYSKKAVKRIFKLKKRPNKNPLIVHYKNAEDANRDVFLNEDFFKLYKKFCPGPLTFVLKKKKNSKIVPEVTANLKTVAIRFPDHKIVRAILQVIKFPLAMPSANISTQLSPTSAYDVFDNFKKKLNIIINGGNSKIGIESTVIDLSNKSKILRPGIISANEIKKILRKNFSNKKTTLKSPGMLKKHYSPGIPIIIGQKPKNFNQAYIVFGKKHKKTKNNYNLSQKGNLKEAAANLYKTMKKIKKKGYKKIFISKIPNIGPGVAINDRIKRASK